MASVSEDVVGLGRVVRVSGVEAGVAGYAIAERSWVWVDR